jgi:hypothetical protein
VTGHTLSTTALVHEAWLELNKLNRIQWQNRAHFLAVAAQAMRRILIEPPADLKRISSIHAAWCSAPPPSNLRSHNGRKKGSCRIVKVWRPAVTFPTHVESSGICGT